MRVERVKKIGTLNKKSYMLFHISNGFFQFSPNVAYLVYLCPFLARGLFMSYLCDLFFIFSFIFIFINYITSFKHIYLFLYIFQNIFYYFWMIMWTKKANNFEIVKFQPQGVAQLLLNFLPISAQRYLQKCCF